VFSDSLAGIHLDGKTGYPEGETELPEKSRFEQARRVRNELT
jgi:hypothetical protein